MLDIHLTIGCLQQNCMPSTEICSTSPSGLDTSTAFSPLEQSLYLYLKLSVIWHQTTALALFLATCTDFCFQPQWATPFSYVCSMISHLRVLALVLLSAEKHPSVVPSAYVQFLLSSHNLLGEVLCLSESLSQSLRGYNWYPSFPVLYIIHMAIHLFYLVNEVKTTGFI